MSRRFITEFIVFSVLIHLAILFALNKNAPRAGGADKIDVKIVERSQVKIPATVLIPPSPSKKISKGHGKVKVPKAPKGEMTPTDAAPGGPPVKLEDYADELKIVVDPVWYAKVEPIRDQIPPGTTTIILIFFDKYGSIKSVKVIKSSGFKEVDQMAVDTFWSVKQIPTPPDILVKKGIIWDFGIN